MYEQLTLFHPHSEVVIKPRASLRFTTTLERCRLCNNPLPVGTLAVVGASKSQLTGYTGGFFHPYCWLTHNQTPNNERIIKMAEDRYSDLSPSELNDIGAVANQAFETDYKLEDITDQEIVVLSFERFTMNYGPLFVVTALVKGKEVTFRCSSKVICDQLDRVEEYLPLKGTIAKVNRYYTFVNPDNS